MTFNITVHGVDEDELTDSQKEELAEDVHFYLQEDQDTDVSGVDVEGYGGSL